MDDTNANVNTTEEVPATDQAPVEETPTEETPVEAPTEETPAEETPAPAAEGGETVSE